jgi:gliding motility-associated-like protein
MCKNIVVFPKPKVHLPADITVCPQTKLPLKSDSVFYKYLWSTNETTRSIFSKPNNGADTVWLEVTTEKGCKDRDTMVINKSPFYLSVVQDTTLVIGQSLILDAGTGFQAYFWSNGDGGETTSVSTPGYYGISVIDSNNCLYSDTIRVRIDIEVQNFFTPNGDGYNDTWAPKIFFNFPESVVEIFDRFGKSLVYYRVSDYPNGWDGTYNGKPLQPDTYWYVIDLKNGIKPITGQVTIKR